MSVVVAILVGTIIGGLPFYERGWRSWLPRIPFAVWSLTALMLIAGTLWFLASVADDRSSGAVKLGIAWGAFLFTAKYLWIGAQLHYHRYRARQR